MREIKFRAWDRVLKDFLWFKLTNFGFEIFKNPNNSLSKDENREFLQQFTGLKDKNGKEIYEGDIISISRTALIEDAPTISDVYFDRGAFRWRHSDWSGSVLSFNSETVIKGYELITQNVEIIGNIYEKPELFKNKDERN